MARWTEFNPNHAAAGSATGGQFTSANGSGSSSSKSTPAKKTTGGAAKSTGPLKTTLAYNPKTNRGPGYGVKGGDPHVHQLQEALNRLGATDSSGRKLRDDGQLGPLTTSAVKEAQRRLGLPQNGKVTPALLSKLMGLKSLPGKPATHHTATTHHATATHHAATAKTKAKNTSKPAAKTSSAAAKAASAGSHSGKPIAEAELVDDEDRVGEADSGAPYGDVAYADPGYQKDGKKRYPIDTKAHAKSAWSYINQADNAALYSAARLKTVKARIVAALKKFGVTVSTSASESFVNGHRSFDEIKDLVRDALTARAKQTSGAYYVWVYIADITDTDVIYTMADEDDLMQCTYEIGDDESVTLGDPFEVVRTYAPADTVRNPPPEADEPEGEDDDEGEGADEAVHDRVVGRVLEAKGTDAAGGKVYRVRIIAYGKSRNKRRYTEAVLTEAVPLYEGAKAYDHHRTLEELQSSTIAGLVGYYRDVQAEADGLYGDLHLLPSATHAAESLDAAIEAQAQGLEPVVGISHDVQCHFQPVVEGGERLQEAVQIVSVDSADIVAKPSAGGKAIRAVAGGETEEESDVPPTKADVLAAFREATDDELAQLGLARAQKTTESTAPAGKPQRATEGEPEAAREAELPKDSFLAKLMVERKVEAAGLPTAVAESMLAELPDRVLESDVDARVASLKSALGMLERHEMRPTATAQVAKEAQEKKIEALDNFFAGNFREGYRSFRQAFIDFTGRGPRTWDEDFNKTIMRESVTAYDSDGRMRRTTEGVERTTESMNASTWSLVLGDSITRRLVAEYNQPSLQTYRQIVSSVVPVNDFRTQRIDRIGGYGTLPVVNQGAPYQPLTSPGNEEVTYAITKKGGTEDLTLEMIANDDVRAIAKIPVKLGLAAAQTLFRFVWDFVNTGGSGTIYDSHPLFDNTNHKNDRGSGAPLTQSNLSAARAAMRKQTAYGDTTDILSIVPRFLVVPTTLEEIAFQLCTSAVAIPGTANTGNVAAAASNTPNIHQGLTPIVVDYFDATSAAAWYTVADPNMCPTFELGFYQGREDPELFTQSDPTVGSVFNSDTVTYKIRHIYSGAVLDYRGFLRAGV